MIFAIAFISCEDVIDFKLKNVEPQIVIEAKLFDKITPATVILSKTTDFFGEPEFITISGADVSISDDLGNKIILPETESGVYSQLFFGTVGRTYTLNVTIENTTFSGTAKMLEPLKIDSLTYQYSEFSFPMQEEGYQVKSYLSNKSEIKDYGQFVFYLNSQKSLTFYLFDDTYVNGNQMDYLFYDKFLSLNDTVAVQMLTCDRGVYDYLYTLSSITGESMPNQGTPYNPVTNLNYGALGYFGVYSTDTKIRIIK